MNTLLLSVLLVSMAHTVGQAGPADPGGWSDAELDRWFEKGDWKQGWQRLPDESVNRRELARQVYGSPERWAKAFAFLRDSDLAGLDRGRHELEGSKLFANVDDYLTRNEVDSRFEAHRRYADIQYVVRGEERIGVDSLGNTTETVPYDSEKDIVFLAPAEGTGEYRAADPGKFFIFFPGDAHRPGVKASANSPVRKIVVKVALD